MPSPTPSAPAADPVALLVGRLERALVAPRGRRRELVREIEGDLREAVAERVAAGTPEPLAASAVVAEFGDPEPLAAELSAELLADGGRRFAPRAALGAGALLVAWFVGMTALAALPGFRVPAEDGWMLLVSRALDAAGPLVAVAAVAGWAAIRRWGSLAALVAVAGLQLAFALAMVGGAVAMAATIAVPSGGAGILAALVAVTLVLGTGLAIAAGLLLARWGAVRLAPLRARSR